MRIEVKFDDEDKALILLSSLPGSYEHLVITLLWGKETLELEDVTSALLTYNQRKLNTGGSQGEVLVAKGSQTLGRSKEKMDRSGRNKSRSKSRGKWLKNIECYKCHDKGHMKRDCPKLKNNEKNKDKGKATTLANVVEDDSDCNNGDIFSVLLVTIHFADA